MAPKFTNVTDWTGSEFCNPAKFHQICSNWLIDPQTFWLGSVVTEGLFVLVFHHFLLAFGMSKTLMASKLRS
jgi:hypothetical protein